METVTLTQVREGLAGVVFGAIDYKVLEDWDTVGDAPADLSDEGVVIEWLGERNTNKFADMPSHEMELEHTFEISLGKRWQAGFNAAGVPLRRIVLRELEELKRPAVIRALLTSQAAALAPLRIAYVSSRSISVPGREILALRFRIKGLFALQLTDTP